MLELSYDYYIKAFKRDHHSRIFEVEFILFFFFILLSSMMSI